MQKSTVQKSTVILMAKAPIPGYVKTRLAGFLTQEQCAGLYRCFLLDIVDCVQASGLELQVAFTPADRINMFRSMLPSGVALFDQEGESLGHRMANAVDHIFRTHKTRCIIIGGDIPTLQPGNLREAAAALEGKDVCLGPAEDGGYYLIALNKPEERLFEGISWGSEWVLAETLDRIKELHLTYHLLPPLKDVDRYEDVLGLRQQLMLNRPPLELMPCRTHGFLKSLSGLKNA